MNIWGMFGVFIFLMVLKIPIAFSLSVSSLIYLATNGISITLVTQKMTNSLGNFIFIALPLYLLAGEIMNKGGITKRLVNLARAIVGRFPGGLAYVNVMVSMLFGGIQGSANADTAAIGSVLIPAMERQGYRRDFSAAITVSSSVIGAIIPPSLLFIIFGSATGVSIGSLFLGGIIPGILLGLSQMGLVFLMGRRKNSNFPPGEKLPLKTSLKYILEGLPVMVLAVIIIGGITTGIVTATESAVLAVVYALIYSLIIKEIKIKDIPHILLKSAVIVGSVMIILASSSIFAYILTQEKTPQMVVELLLGISQNKIVLLLMLNLFLLFVGTFMDSTPAVLILAPILLPVLLNLGMDPIHIGVFMCFNLIQGLITPPVGSCLYVCSGIANISVGKISRAMIPFLIINVSVLLLITYVPQLVTFIPSLFK